MGDSVRGESGETVRGEESGETVREEESGETVWGGEGGGRGERERPGGQK